jgi:predicted ArsR family transcriptional regulator
MTVTPWTDRLLGETQAKLLLLLRRSRQTISSLMEALDLTDNAIRSHVASLERSGIVQAVGTQRDTGGKPARVYALTRAGEELFPKAYAMVLGALVDEIGRQEGRPRAKALLEAVGERLGAGVMLAGEEETGEKERVPGRVLAAVNALRGLGADIDIERQHNGWRLQGYACPLSAVTRSHPDVCALARALVEQVTGRPVTECCDRSDSPRCAFVVEARSA